MFHTLALHYWWGFYKCHIEIPTPSTRKIPQLHWNKKPKISNWINFHYWELCIGPKAPCRGERGGPFWPQPAPWPHRLKRCFEIKCAFLLKHPDLLCDITWELKGGNVCINHLAYEILPWDILPILADKWEEIEMFFPKISLFFSLFLSLSCASHPPLSFQSPSLPLCSIVFVVLLVMHGSASWQHFFIIYLFTFCNVN